MKVICSKISVDCQENDSVDIRSGGPQYLGYDFFVREEEADKMISFIKQTCAKLNVPICHIYCDKAARYEREEGKVWTKDRIHACIKNNEAGLDLSSTHTL